MHVPANITAMVSCHPALTFPLNETGWPATAAAGSEVLAEGSASADLPDATTAEDFPAPEGRSSMRCRLRAIWSATGSLVAAPGANHKTRMVMS